METMITTEDPSLEQATSDRPTLPDAVLPRQGDEASAGEAQGDPEAARLRVLGVLAAGFAQAIEAEIRLLDRHFEEQRELVEVLRDRSQVRAGGAGAEEATAALVARTADCWGALKRAQKTARRFASGTQAGAPERIDLGMLADEVLSVAGPYLRDRRVEVELHAPRGHVVVGRRAELLQLLVHVLLGAVAAAAAAPTGAGAASARARLALEIRRQGAHEILCASFAESGGAVALTGSAPRGFAGDLALIRQIVGAHEGHVEMAASGIPCSIVLPGARTPESSAGASPKLGPPARRAPVAEARPVVLWIDADALFIEIMVHALPELDIRGVRSATEAERLADQGASPALILCNVQLPDLSGPALHAAIARRRPELARRFVFVADGALRPDMASYLIGTGRSILMRPIDLDHVRALLSPPPAPPAVSTASARPPADSRTAATEPALPAVRPLTTPSPAMPPSPPSTVPPSAVPPSAVPVATVPVANAPVANAPVASAQVLEAQHPAVRLPAHMSEIVPVDAAAPPTLPKTEVATRVFAEGARDQRLRALAHEIAEALRYGGPMKGSSAIAMLRGHGVDEAMGLAALACALSTGMIVRDPPPSTLLRAPNKHRSVLVVDDDYDLRQILRDILEDHGYDVETAENGAVALQILRASPSPPVVLLDLMMPVMDGWQLLEELRRDTTLAGIPVVVVTASRNPGPLSGVREALSKPLDYFKLVRSIDRSLRLRSPLSP